MATGPISKSVEILETRDEEGEIILFDLDREGLDNRLIIDTDSNEAVVFGYGRTRLDALQTGRRLSEDEVPFSPRGM